MSVLPDLSPREIELLELIRDDRTNAQAAYEMCITEQTIKNHMTSIFHKLGVQSRTSAVVKSIRLGFISLTPDDSPRPDSAVLMDAITAMRCRTDEQLDELIAAVARSAA